MQSFRVFVSSTFEDMRAEREALHASVFRNLTEYCAARGARFQAIDLRWGISDGDSRARQTMRICLDEMRRACDLSPQLYLLVLLGHRYGWRPLPWRIPAADFDAMLAAARSRRAAFTAWYERDDNAVPAEYRLRDRPRSARAPSEDELRAILDDALGAFVPRGDPRWVAYAGSAVHQEIAEARRHAGDARGALCYVREPRPAAGNPGMQPSLDGLEDELRGWLGPSVSSYSATPPLEPFCQAVEDSLKQRIDAALDQGRGASHLAAEIAAHTQFARERVAGFHGRREGRRRIRGYLTNNSDRPFVIAGTAGCGKSAMMAQCAADARAALPGAVIVQRFVGATASSSDLRSLLDGLRDEIAGAFAAPLQPAAHDVETAIPRWTESLGSGQEQRPLVVFLDAVDQVENRDGVELLDWLPRHLPPHTKLVASLAEADSNSNTAHDREPAGTGLRLSGLSWPEARNALRAWMRSALRTIQPAQERAIQARFARCPLPLFLKLAFEQARGWTSGDRRVRVARGLDGIVDAALDAFELRHGRELVGHALRYLGTARFGLAEDEMVSALGQRREVLRELRRRSPESPRADELPVAVWARLYADLAPYLAQRAGAGISLLGFYHRVVGKRAAERYGAMADARRAHRELALFFGGRPVLRATEATGETADPRTAAEMPFHLTRARMWRELGQTLGDLQFARAKCMAGMVHDLVNDYEAALQAGAKGPLAGSLEQFLAFVRRDAHTLGRYAGMPAFIEQQAHNFRRGGPVRNAIAKSAGKRAAAPWFKRLNVPDSNPIVQATMTRHTASVLDCVFTPDGLHLLSCGNDGAIRMWTPDRWAHVKRVAQLPATARSCDIAPDGSFVVSAGGDGVIRRHDLASGEMLEFRHRVPEAERCRISPDGDYVLACGEKGAVLFDVSGRKLWARAGVYYDVAFRGDGVAVLAGHDIHLITVPKGGQAGGADVEARHLYGCAFSPDRRTLLVAGGTDTALYEHRRAGMAWTMDAAAPAASDHATHEFPESALSCRFLLGGGEYAIGLRSGALLIFRTADGQQLRALGDHTGAIRGMAISPDGRHLVTASLDSRLHAYACSDLRQAGTEQAPGAAAFSAFATGGREAHLWHARPSNVRMDFGETVCRIDSPDADVSFRPLNPDVGFGDVRIAGPGVAFNESSGALLPAVDGGRHSTPHRTAPACGRSAEAYWLFAVGSRMTGFDLHFLPPLEDGRQHSRAVTWARSADKWRFAVLRRDGLAIYRDDVKRRAEIGVPPMPRRGARPPVCFFSTSGDRLFFTAEHAIAVIDVERARVERLLDCGTDTPSAFCESRDRKRLLGGGAGGALWEWDLDTGAPRWHHSAHDGSVIDCAYFDEGNAMSIGEDRTLCLWTPPAAKPVAVYCADAALSTFSLSADRRFVVAGDVHGGVHLLELIRPSGTRDDAGAGVDPWAPVAGALATPERMVHDVIAHRLAAASPALDLAILCVFHHPPAEPEEWQLTVAGERVSVQRGVLPPVDVIIKASIDDWRLILTGELPVVFELFGSRPSVTGHLGSITRVLPALFPPARTG